MQKRNLCFMLLVSTFLPLVYAENPFFEYFYNKYHKHSTTTSTLSSVKESFTTELTSNLGSVSYSAIESSSQTEDDHSSEEISSSGDDNLSSPSVTFKDDFNSSSPPGVFHNNYNTYNDNSGSFGASIAIVAGCVCFVLVCLGCLACCCPSCCRTERRGVILRNNREERGTEVSPQPIITQYPSPPAGCVIQHQFPGSPEPPIQQFPPLYQQQPGIPQYQQHPAMPQYQQQLSPQQYQQQTVQPQMPYTPMQPDLRYSPNSMQFHNPPEAPPPYEPTAPNKF